MIEVRVSDPDGLRRRFRRSALGFLCLVIPPTVIAVWVCKDWLAGRPTLDPSAGEPWHYLLAALISIAAAGAVPLYVLMQSRSLGKAIRSKFLQGSKLADPISGAQVRLGASVPKPLVKKLDGGLFPLGDAIVLCDGTQKVIVLPSHLTDKSFEAFDAAWRDAGRETTSYQPYPYQTRSAGYG